MSKHSWALTPSSLAVLGTLLHDLRPNLALEFGSGFSTVLLRRFCGRTISLEHHPKWWRTTAQMVATEIEDLLLAPITEIKTPAGPLPTYDAVLPDGIDFVLIDGPPGAIGRAGTLFSVWPHLAADATIVLDDASRQAEQDIVNLWARHLPIEAEPLSQRLLAIRPVR